MNETILFQKGSMPSSNKLTTVLYRLLLFLSIVSVSVGLNPFPERLQFGASGNSSSRVLLAIEIIPIIVIVIFLAFVVSNVSRMWKAIPTGLALLFGWSLVSLSWSPDPLRPITNLTLMILFTYSVILPCTELPVGQTLKTIRIALLTILVADFVSVALVPLAIHPANDTFENLAGAWRGIHPHKNHAGAFVALSGLFFSASYWNERKVLDLIGLLAAIIFLAFSQSKAAILLFAAILPSYVVWRAMPMATRPVVWWIFTIALLIWFAAASALGFDFSTAIDDNSFTGRGRLWKDLWRYIIDHPILGGGFSSVMGQGPTGPLMRYSSGDFTIYAGATHNSFLEVQVGLGIFGSLLFFYIFIFEQAYRQVTAIKTNERAFLAFAILWPFLICHSLFESNFSVPMTSQWLFFVIIIGVGKQVISSSRALPNPASSSAA